MRDIKLFSFQEKAFSQHAKKEERRMRRREDLCLSISLSYPLSLLVAFSITYTLFQSLFFFFCASTSLSLRLHRSLYLELFSEELNEDGCENRSHVEIEKKRRRWKGETPLRRFIKSLKSRPSPLRLKFSAHDLSTYTLYIYLDIDTYRYRYL